MEFEIKIYIKVSRPGKVSAFFILCQVIEQWQKSKVKLYGTFLP